MSNVYKLLSGMLTIRLNDVLEGLQALPDEQHGFRKERSTLTAYGVLFSAINRVLSRKAQSLFVVFVDFKAAFDSGSRTLVVQQLAELGVPFNVLGLLVAILQENRVTNKCRSGAQGQHRTGDRICSRGRPESPPVLSPC